MEELTLAEFMKDPARYSEPDEEQGPYQLGRKGAVLGLKDLTAFRAEEHFGENKFATIQEARDAWTVFQARAFEKNTWGDKWQPGGEYHDRNGVVVLNKDKEIVFTIKPGPADGG